jgi:hypothetical protein
VREIADSICDSNSCAHQQGVFSRNTSTFVKERKESVEYSEGEIIVLVKRVPAPGLGAETVHTDCGMGSTQGILVWWLCFSSDVFG